MAFSFFKSKLMYVHVCGRSVCPNAHWSENAVLGQQFVFSRFWADFDAQYGKLGVLRVKESIYEKKKYMTSKVKDLQSLILPFSWFYWTFRGGRRCPIKATLKYVFIGDCIS